MKHLTIRGIPPDLAPALDEARKRRGTSLTQAVKDLLRQALGLSSERSFDNGLARFAGGWSEREYADFERAVEVFEKPDHGVAARPLPPSRSFLRYRVRPTLRATARRSAI